MNAGVGAVVEQGVGVAVEQTLGAGRAQRRSLVGREMHYCRPLQPRIE